MPLNDPDLLSTSRAHFMVLPEACATSNPAATPALSVRKSKVLGILQGLRVASKYVGNRDHPAAGRTSQDHVRCAPFSRTILSFAGAPVDTYDLFFSYRRTALPRAEPLLEALEHAGLRVWRDQTTLPDFESITQAIRAAIAASKVLIAFCSPDYFESRPCQQECAAAWLAAGQGGRRPYDRVLVVNPEDSFTHLPKIFAEQQSVGWARDPADFAGLARRIRAHIDSLEGVLGDVQSGAGPVYVGMKPFEAKRFVGRVREIWDLNDLLTAHRMGIATGQVGRSLVQVRGLGGSGKTLLAREYAIRFGPAYPGGIFWLRASGDNDDNEVVDAPDPFTLRLDQIRTFAPHVGASLDGLQPGEIEPEFWGAIEKRGKPCLWIVDDLPPGLPIKEVEQNWAAGSDLASTLITTRSSEYRSTGTGLDLGAISPDQAMQLLAIHEAPDGESERAAASEIAAGLGYHPLAIDVAGAVIALSMSFSKYREALRNSAADAVELGVHLSEALPTGHHPSIAFTLLKSIELLGREGLDLLCLAAGLAPGEIPLSLMREVFDQAGPRDQFGARALAAVSQADSFCLCSAVGNDARIVHTLVSRTIRFQTRTRRRVAELRLAAAQALSRRLLLLDDLRRRHEVVRELDHARHILSLDIQPIEVLDIGLQVASHDFRLGDYASALNLQRHVSESRSMRLGTEHPATLAARGDLAGTMFAIGDRDGARKTQQAVLGLCRRSLGSKSQQTLRAMNGLALTFLHLGDLAGARALLQELLQKAPGALSDDDPLILTAMSNLAGTLTAQGDLQGARKLQEQVLAARSKLLGPDDESTLNALNSLALILHQQGDLEGARTRHEKVLTARRKLLGDNHPSTIMAADHVARVALSEGNLDTALRLQQDVLEARSRLLGKDHPDTLRSMTRVATTLQAKGDSAGAEALYKDALRLSLQRLGSGHPDVMDIQTHLGLILTQRGDFIEARALQEEVLDGTRSRLGPEHHNTAVAAWNLCQTLLALHDVESARRVFHENLIFLLGVDPETLPPALRQIQLMSGMVGRPTGT